jgi:hypothetical protein
MIDSGKVGAAGLVPTANSADVLQPVIDRGSPIAALASRITSRDRVDRASRGDAAIQPTGIEAIVKRPLRPGERLTGKTIFGFLLVNPFCA